MLTVLEAIKLSTEYLEKKGIESPRTNAELLLAGILNCKRLDLYLSYDRPLDEDEKQNYRTFISKRGNFEPLQYILGQTEFFGLNFIVNPSVLIPRPETEILVETIINENKHEQNITILDIGTGSGNIPVSLAKNITGLSITSIDISEEALKTALQNAELNSVSDKISFIKQNIFDTEVYNLGEFDIIVSNPPYVEKDEMKNLQKEIINYEPHNAVTDGGDGYKYYKRIAEVSSKLLKPKGKIYFELGIGQSEKVTNILKEHNFANVKNIKDYQNINRVISGEKL